MSIYIYKNNRQAGPFEENAVLGWLKNGALSPEDLACRTGANSWQTLRTLLTAGMPSPPAAASGSGQKFCNQPVVNWARQNLPNRVEVKLKFNSLAVKIILFLAILSIPGGFVILGIYMLIAGEGKSSSAFIGALILALLLAPLFGFLWLTRKKIIKFFDADGVETLYGKKYAWEDLYFINYKNVRTRGLAQAAVFAGSDRIAVELIFANGKAIVPPLVKDQAAILALINSIPAERRGASR